MATRKGSADKRDAALLHISQRLAETDGKITPAAMLKELKQSGQGYRKTEFLKDFAGVKGTPQRTPTPGQIRGGLVSGVMRRKDVKALPESDKATVKRTAQLAIERIAESNDLPRRGFLIVTNPITGKLSIEAASSWEQVEALPDGAEVKGNIKKGELAPESLDVLLSVFDNLYAKLT